jgi:UTP--glucose-1-phosphate uridylyltransferase
MTHGKSRIRTALIPVAGKGTRLWPITSVIPKAMMPLVDSRGNILSVLHVIIRQVMSAGVARVGIIVSDGQQDTLNQYFTSVEKSTGETISSVIEYIHQPQAKGFGDAVLRGWSFVGKEPFVLLLGDHIHIQEDGSPSCVKQVIDDFVSRTCVAMVGVQPVQADELANVGVCRGIALNGQTFQCDRFVEKPDLSVARKDLVTEGLPANTYLAHGGIYVFTSEIFTCLQAVADDLPSSRSELELADAQAMLLERYPDQYLLHKIRSVAYDVGTPEGYVHAQSVYRQVDVRTKKLNINYGL